MFKWLKCTKIAQILHKDYCLAEQDAISIAKMLKRDGAMPQLHSNGRHFHLLESMNAHEWAARIMGDRLDIQVSDGCDTKTLAYDKFIIQCNLVKHCEENKIGPIVFGWLAQQIEMLDIEYLNAELNPLEQATLNQIWRLELNRFGEPRLASR